LHTVSLVVIIGVYELGTRTEKHNIISVCGYEREKVVFNCLFSMNGLQPRG